jgi:hypothetical protein
VWRGSHNFLFGITGPKTLYSPREAVRQTEETPREGECKIFEHCLGEGARES